MSELHPTNESYDEMTRLEELLADQALFGLDLSEQAELERLSAETSDSLDAYDLSAAKIFLAQADHSHQPSVALRERIMQSAPQNQAPQIKNVPASVAEQSASKPETYRSSITWGGLLAAMAASLFLGIYLGTPKPPKGTDLIQARAALIEEKQETVTVDWSATDDPSAIGIEGTDREQLDWGDVVWNDKTQTGYMRFRGLAANDPSVEQYQLWIFDSERDDAHPVDGGVFNISSDIDGNQVVEIDPKLPITKAVMFAITIEKPGGVVVSDRSRLPLLAKL